MSDGQATPDPSVPADGTPAAAAAARPAAGGKKKRAYAGAAFDVGAGANAGLGGQQPGGAAAPPLQNTGYGGYPQQPAVSGSGQPTASAQPAYGQPAYGQPAYGQPAYGQPAYGGPEPTQGAGQQPAYGAQAGYSAPDQSGVSGVTQQFQQMGVSGQPAPPAGAPAPAILNRLQTSDLISQPFHVSEVDLPPPAIAMPPNVSIPECCPQHSKLTS